MKIIGLFVILGVIAFLIGGGIAMQQSGKNKDIVEKKAVSPTLAPLDANNIFTLVNKHRKGIGVNELSFNQKLCAFAQKRAEQLITNYSHDGYVPVPYTYRIASENIGGGISDEIIVKSWLNSKSHRQALEDGRYTDTCVAVYKDYAVQHFASF
jgi:uncharacterized protein YkwD